MFLRICFFVFVLSLPLYSQGQKRSLIAFYNLENLYDTINQPEVLDEEFLPDAPKQWTGQRYRAKLGALAKVIAQIGTDQGLALPDVLGVCELENRGVLTDLAGQPELKHAHYKIVHRDSPDRRGIDVALLYNPSVFEVTTFRTAPLTLTDDSTGVKFASRDQLVVSGKLKGEPMHFIVNHWPSRLGGEGSNSFREYAAQITRSLVDSILKIEPLAKIVVLGDFNDNPTDASITHGLNAQAEPRDAYLWNTTSSLYAQGKGTLVYRDEWFLFDQILVTPGFYLAKKGWRWSVTGIVAHAFMLQTEGKYKGYPSRTYAGKRYLGGYSDHLPSYMVLQKGR